MERTDLINFYFHLGMMTVAEKTVLYGSCRDDCAQTMRMVFRGSEATLLERVRQTSWWDILRKEGLEYWIQLLGELRDEGGFDGDLLEKALLQLCVTGIIQEDLNNIEDVWNAHRIRPVSNPNVPHGIPNVMYSTPELWDTEDCAMPLDQEELDMSKGQCVFRSCIHCDEDVFDLCMIVVEELGLQFPSKSPLEAFI